MLLKKFKNIERAMGRKKVKKRWGARIIDLDILLYDSAVVKNQGITPLSVRRDRPPQA
jgi:2-amino-4-hydroxy-6-hydroxymethyldihydropteridine diphosphokinase